VARRLRRHAKTVRPRVVHDRGDVGGRLDEDDRRGLLVDGEVPGLPGEVPAVVAG
jgi:hypothetical protein